MKMYGTRWSGLCGGQDKGSKTEMVQIVKRRCTNVPVRWCKKLARAEETLYTRSISKSSLPTGKCDYLQKKKTFSYTNRNLMGTPQVNKKQKARCSNLYKVVF